MGRRRMVVMVAGVVIAASGVAAGRAHAFAGAPDAGAPAGMWAGTCGGWHTTSATRTLDVFVCASGPEVAALTSERPAAFASVSSCARRRPYRCRTREYWGDPGTGGLTVDPLLRTAGVHTTLGTCRIDVDIAAAGDPQTSLGSYEYVSHGSGLVVALGGGLDMLRDASLAGSVCGLTARGPANAVLWRSAAAGTWLDTSPEGEPGK